MRRSFSATVIATLVLALAGCGSSSTSPSATSTVSTADRQKAALTAECAKTLSDYLTLHGDIGAIAQHPQNSAAYGTPVADTATLKTDLATIRPPATAAEQAQIDQYATVLGQLETGLQTAAGGDFGTALGQITGVAQQIGAIPALVSQICPA